MMTSNREVLPIPFRPMMPHRSPRATCTDTSLKIVVSAKRTATPAIPSIAYTFAIRPRAATGQMVST